MKTTSQGNRGTILGYNNYWMNLDSGIVYRLDGKRMKPHINKRGNKVVNLIRDDGVRNKVNLDREWLKLVTSLILDQFLTDENKEEIGDISSLNQNKNRLTTQILMTYFNSLSVKTSGMSTLYWTNYILTHTDINDRSLIREVLVKLRTGVTLEY